MQIGSIYPNEFTEAQFNIRAPINFGKYTSYFRMGYQEKDMINFFGEKPWITVEVKVDTSSKALVSSAFENNLKQLTDMGFNRDACISMLKMTNNDLSMAIQYLTSSQQH